ncbi:MAG TPA: sensor histidine kinase [Longimicrobiaceae bacterium]
MRLHEYILTNREKILAEWETFAATCSPASATMDVSALRDHASEMLTVIAKDLETYQSGREQAQKSVGQAPDTELEPTAAEQHGAGRAVSGFTVEQMVAEYRALRASVLRLWTRDQGELKSSDIDDLTRFNEAIDQSLAESVSEFNENIEAAKEMFLAILGHDLRTPLGAIYTSARFLLETGEMNERNRSLIARIASSATRTVGMVGDLLDFTRSRLGGGIPVTRTGMDLGKVLQDVVDEIGAARPERRIVLELSGEQRGEWDEARISQAFVNLIANAVEHGSSGVDVTVAASGDADEVTVRIHNQGKVIEPTQLDGLFNPMKTRTSPHTASSGGPTGNLGLGLYITERIVHAHHGRIEVESSPEAGTTFTVHLPRLE